MKETNERKFRKKGSKELKANGRQCYSKLRFSRAVSRSVEHINSS